MSSATLEIRQAPRVLAADRRWLHPVAWWAWAIGVAIAASATRNPLLLGGLMVATAFVVQQRKPVAPWARSFGFFVRLAIIVVAIRVIAQMLIGAPGGTIAIVPLPGATLPDWLAGIRLGGTVMAEPLLAALYDGLRLATILVAVGAASALASPARLLKSVPAAVYEVGVSVVVATTFLPQLVTDVARVRANRRLRGRSDSGLRGIAASAMPVLHGAMDRSITLAAAMDSRGYGRTGHRSMRERRLSGGALLAGLIFATIGTYGLLGTGSAPIWSLLLMSVGIISATFSMVLAGKRSTRTRYRPNLWKLPDVVTAACGAGVASAFLAASWINPLAMSTATSPPAWPSIPFLAVLGIALVTLPAFVTPEPPQELVE